MTIDYQSLRSALSSGGLIPDDIVAGRLVRCRAEGDRHGRRSGAYRLFDDDMPACPWWNWRTGASGVWVSSDRPLTDAERNRHRAMMEEARRERAAEQAAQRARNRRYLAKFWSAAGPITQGCPAGLYLAHRGLPVPVGNALRFVPRLDFWHDDGHVSWHPAMLAAVTSRDGDLVAIHRTYLTGDGRKAPVPTPKKLTRTAGPMAGASVKIGAPISRPDGRLGLAVAEGIETAIAAAVLTGVPTWSCVSAHGLETFVPPAGVHSLYIMADHDESGTGQRAAALLAQRAAAAGLVARVLVPEAVGDWNDELISRRAAA